MSAARSVWSYFAPAGWATEWYWPPGVHGCVYNFLHGNGWLVE